MTRIRLPAMIKEENQTFVNVLPMVYGRSRLPCSLLQERLNHGVSPINDAIHSPKTKIYQYINFNVAMLMNLSHPQHNIHIIFTNHFVFISYSCVVFSDQDAAQHCHVTCCGCAIGFSIYSRQAVFPHSRLNVRMMSDILILLVGEYFKGFHLKIKKSGIGSMVVSQAAFPPSTLEIKVRMWVSAARWLYYEMSWSTRVSVFLRAKAVAHN